MKRRAVVLFLAACLFSTVLATVFGGSGATAQTPSVDVEDVICPEPTPTPSPTDTASPEPTVDPTIPSDEALPEECDDEDDNNNGNNGGNKGGDDNNKPDRPDGPGNDGNDRNGGNDGQDDKRRGSDKDARDGRDSKDKKAKRSKDKKKKRNDKDSGSFGGFGKFDATGEFDTDRLELIAAQLRARGLDEDEILERVYAPFIIGGPAAWTDTWGAPRYGPGPLVRTHEGQDVFCKYGDPVLATEDGEIEFDDGGLGGKVARLYRKDGSYWYYAHLSGWNTKDFENGDRVEAGDVIGFCGNTGNAITTPPHVHFGWYQANGKSRDPMGMLVKWLRIAERNAGVAYEKETGRSIADLDQEGSRRLLGDGFAPDISELKVSSEALLGASSSPGAGGLGLADAALQAALAATGDNGSSDVEVDTEGAGDDHSELVELLHESQGETAAPGGATGD